MLEYIYSKSPTPYIYFPELLPPELFKKVRFPDDIPITSAGRTGRDQFIGEPGWTEAIESDGLRELHQMFCGAEFISWVLSIFDRDLARWDCRVRAKDAKVIDYMETREALDKWPHRLPGDHDVNELFNRFDFSIGEAGYTSYAHLDSVRRIVGGLLFFSDADAEGLVGGEFTLYRDLLFNNDRAPHWPIPTKKFPVKANTGVLFLNCNSGFHGPSPIQAIEGHRKWIYYSISSRIPVWEPGKPRLFSRMALSLLRKLGQEWRFLRPTQPNSVAEANRHVAEANRQAAEANRQKD